MILFVNVLVTEQSLTYYERGFLKKPSRVDVFLYSMASWAVLPWTKCFFYISFDETTSYQKERVLLFLEDLFPGASIVEGRLERQWQWQQAVVSLEEVDEDLVCFLCNDDHVFVDSDPALWCKTVDLLRVLRKNNEYVCFPFSHWPEHLWMFIKRGCNVVDRSALITMYESVDSIQVCNKATLRHWWFAYDYGDSFLPRTDWTTMMVPAVASVGVLPLREMVRHFDGYSHVGIDIDDCPPLSIPDGFFERRMTVVVNGPKEPGAVSLNPSAAHYSAVDPQGADLKVPADRMPLFWRDRVASIRHDRAETAEDRDAATRAFLRLASSAHRVPLARLVHVFSQSAFDSAPTDADSAEVERQQAGSLMSGLLMHGVTVMRWPFATPDTEPLCALVAMDNYVQALPQDVLGLRAALAVGRWDVFWDNQWPIHTLDAWQRLRQAMSLASGVTRHAPENTGGALLVGASVPRGRYLAWVDVDLCRRRGILASLLPLLERMLLTLAGGTPERSICLVLSDPDRQQPFALITTRELGQAKARAMLAENPAVTWRHLLARMMQDGLLVDFFATQSPDALAPAVSAETAVS